MVHYGGLLQGTGSLTVFPRPVPSPCDITCFHVIRWSAVNLESFHLKFQFNGICAAEQKIQSAVVWGGMQIQPAELQSCLEQTQDDCKETGWFIILQPDEENGLLLAIVVEFHLVFPTFKLHPQLGHLRGTDKETDIFTAQERKENPISISLSSYNKTFSNLFMNSIFVCSF